MPARLLIFVVLSVAFPAIAATTTWKAYDLKNCKHWSMTPDDFQGSGPRFAKADATAKRANSGEVSSAWIVVQGAILWEDDEPWYGVCRFDSEYTTISCLAGVDFPLSGATYKLVKQKGADATYLCNRGCEETEIKMVLEMAYEEATVFSKQAAQLIRKFEGQCHDTAKRAKFFQLLDQRQRSAK